MVISLVGKHFERNAWFKRLEFKYLDFRWLLENFRNLLSILTLIKIILRLILISF